MASRMKDMLPAWLDRLYLLCMWIAGLGIVAMSLVIPWGVFARYVLGSGSQWPEPVAIMLMTVFTFFGAAVTYRAAGHIAVKTLTQAVPPRWRRAMEIAADLLMLALSGFMVVWGFKLVLETMGQTLSDLPWVPVGISYLPLPVGSLITVAFILEKMAFGSQHQRPICRLEHEVDEVAVTAPEI
jgi:TRAP-type C4-dicarboxylate transport system permease small subunit